jgi:predicted DsbA family dithiol-disulfide isomerase
METLTKAARDADLNEAEVKDFLESGEDRMTVKNQIRMANGEIDGVPHIVIYGRKRDFTIDGAVEEEKYVQTFILVDKEFN